MPPTKTASRTLPFASLLFAAAVLFSVALAELATRALGIAAAIPRFCPGERENRSSENFAADARVGWRMHPASHFTFETEGVTIDYFSDAEGLRAAHVAARPPANPVARVVIAGDSHAWGYGVPYEDSLAGRLQEALPTVEIRNLAMPGYGLDQIWRSVVELGLPHQPDAVIVAVYPDDLERSMTAYRASEGFNKPSYRTQGGRPVLRRPEDCPSAVERFLERESRLYALFGRMMRRLGRDHGVGQWWTLNEAILDEIHREADRAGVPLLFVHVPFPSWKPFRALDRYMEKRGASYLDLYERLGEDGKEHYLPRDGHLNAKGHRFLSQQIADWLKAEEIL